MFHAVAQEDTVKYMLKEGLVFSVANLSKVGDGDITHLCATLMNRLTLYPAARAGTHDGRV